MLSDENRAFVKHITGCVPLLLHSLFRFKGQPFNEEAFMCFKELRDIQSNISDFYDHFLKGLAEEYHEQFAVSSNAHTCFNFMQVLRFNASMFVPNKTFPFHEGTG